MSMNHRVACVIATATLLSASAQAAEKAAGSAADYPNKPIRLIVPAPTGSGPDANARVLTAGLNRALGQQILIDNRPGASGIIGTQLAAKATPDGYTLLLALASVFGSLPNLYEKLPFDLDRDFMPISMIEMIPCALVVNPSVPAKTVAEFIALAKSKPGQLTFGSAGNGSFQSTPDMKVVVSLTLSGQNPVQARFTPLEKAQVAIPVLADKDRKHDGMAANMANGEIRKVDKHAKKITIKHGALTNLDMPAMTMVFQVKDAKMLEQVKAGDKVKFIAEYLGGALTVTRIEAAKNPAAK